MPALRELQASVRDAILGEPGEGHPALAAVAADGLGAAARLAIYRHHVLSSLTAVLESAFPAVCRLVDRRFFAYAADRFVRAHPPASPCLAEYGASFAGFLADFPPCRHLEYLPDVARLEWAVHGALQAPDAAPLDPARLGAVAAADVAGLRLRLDPSLTLLASAWPVDRIWAANRAADGVVNLDAGGVHLEIRRVGDEARVRRLDPARHALRRALCHNRTLGQAARAALAVDRAFDLAVAMREVLDEGIAIDFTLARKGARS